MWLILGITMLAVASAQFQFDFGSMFNQQQQQQKQAAKPSPPSAEDTGWMPYMIDEMDEHQSTSVR
jgi:hypothetical protein